jgi:hypothetical protein
VIRLAALLGDTPPWFVTYHYSNEERVYRLWAFQEDRVAFIEATAKEFNPANYNPTSQQPPDSWNYAVCGLFPLSVVSVSLGDVGWWSQGGSLSGVTPISWNWSMDLGPAVQPVAIELRLQPDSASTDPRVAAIARFKGLLVAAPANG